MESSLYRIPSDMQKKDSIMSETDHIGSISGPFRVGILPIAGFPLMSYACTVEPLRAANLLSQRSLYEIVHFGQAPRTSSSGAAMVERSYEVGDTVDLDLLLVLAGGDPFSFDDAHVFTWLNRMARTGVQIGGVSGGPVVLVKAGLMDGHRMTVHWEHAPLLTEHFRDVIVERRLFVIDRDRVTCGGGTAPLDLMHALITSHHGGVFARHVSDWFLHTDIRAETAPQRAAVSDRVGTTSPRVHEAVSLMESHIADPLSLSQVAFVAGVTPRHLNRLFTETMGSPAMTYYRSLRLSVGRRLVHNSSMNMSNIAEATGFSNAGHFSNAYKAEFGVRPQFDRRRAPAHISA